MKFAKPYNDLREFIAALDEAGKLYRIHKEINKDTELQPLVRWQFRGLPEEARKGFLFDKVTDTKKGKYYCSVLVGGLAGSEAIYCLGLKCRPDEVADRWIYAMDHPIEPVIVAEGSCQEEIHKDDELIAHRIALIRIARPREQAVVLIELRRVIFERDAEQLEIRLISGATLTLVDAQRQRHARPVDFSTAHAVGIADLEAKRGGRRGDGGLGIVHEPQRVHDRCVGAGIDRKRADRIRAGRRDIRDREVIVLV